MEVVVNGKPRDVPEGSTVADLLGDLGLGARNVVVELNGDAMERARFVDAELHPGDKVEVVRAVAGG